MYFAGSTRAQYFEGPPFFCPGCRNYCPEGGDKYHQRSTIKSFMTIILTGRAARPLSTLFPVVGSYGGPFPKPARTAGLMPRWQVVYGTLYVTDTWSDC